MKMKKLLIVALSFMMLFAFAACGSGGTGEAGQTGYPMTVTDGSGAQVTIEEEPDKIVSLSPSCTEILYSLGLGDKMVGVSTWCTYPEEATKVEQVGDTFSVNLERIIELDADIVFVSGHAGTDAVGALNQAGIAVYCMSTGSLEDIYSNILAIGTVTNSSEQAETVVADMKADAEALKEEFAAYETKSLFIDLGDLYSTSKVDYLGNSLELINVENIALDFDHTSPHLSAETVIQKNPDVYIAMCGESEFVMPDGFEEIAAFKNKEVHYIEYEDPRTDMITRDGPRFIEGLRELGSLVHQTEKE